MDNHTRYYCDICGRTIAEGERAYTYYAGESKDVKWCQTCHDANMAAWVNDDEWSEPPFEFVFKSIATFEEEHPCQTN
jgi:hypothetical protein